MDFHPELEITQAQHAAIQTLRNKSFPEHQVTRFYFKQLPRLRALKYCDSQLIAHMELDYRAIRVGSHDCKH